MSGKFWIAVDAYVLDIALKPTETYQRNLAAWNLIDRVSKLNAGIGIFVATDSTVVNNAYRQRYGGRVFSTANNPAHFEKDTHHEIAIKLLVEASIATRCNYFIGNNDSLVSHSIAMIKKWPEQFSIFLGDAHKHNHESTFIHALSNQNHVATITGIGEPATERKIVLFYNDFHNGDVHMSRSYVRDLMNLLGNCDFYYCHKNDPRLLNDIENLNSISEMIFADLTINTWIGQFHYRGMDFSEAASSNFVFLGCNFIHYYAVMSQVYADIGFGNKLKPISNYVPEIDYSKFFIENITNFFENNSSPSVLFCNNAVLSGQAPDVDFSTIVETLSSRHPSINFILSNLDGFKYSRNNIFYCSDIVKSPEKINDLNEISYISIHCKIIVGRSSGPSSFSMVKENTHDKIFVCICHFEKDSWARGGGFDVRWTDQASIDYLIPMFENLISECLLA
jgi:hypothetical protein